jgi:hypothetical protein
MLHTMSSVDRMFGGQQLTLAILTLCRCCGRGCLEERSREIRCPTTRTIPSPRHLRGRLLVSFENNYNLEPALSYKTLNHCYPTN